VKRATSSYSPGGVGSACTWGDLGAQAEQGGCDGHRCEQRIGSAKHIYGRQDEAHLQVTHWNRGHATEARASGA